MKKKFLCIIALLLVLTSVFVLQHTPISSDEVIVYEDSIPLTEETKKQPDEEKQDIEIPQKTILMAEETEEQSVKESSDITVPEKPLPVAEETEKQTEEEIVDKLPKEQLSVKEEAINETIVEEKEKEIKQGTFCSIEIICNQVLENMEKLPDEKKGIIPTNGVILAQTKAEFFENESVFNVTSRELKARKLHIDFVYTPMYNSVYIKGIGNLYEKDCGAGSGWVYTVNGQSSDCGASAYKLKDGDKIQWTYILR